MERRAEEQERVQEDPDHGKMIRCEHIMILKLSWTTRN